MKIMCKCDGMKQSDTPYMQDFAGFHSNAYGAGCSSFGSQTERPGTILTWVQLPGAVRDFFSWNHLSMQTLLWSSHSFCVQSKAPTSVCTFTIPNTGSHTNTIACTLKNAAHTGSNE